MKVELYFDEKRTLYVNSEEHGTKIFKVTDVANGLDEYMIDYLDRILFS